MMEDILEVLWKVLRWIALRIALAGLLLLVLWLALELGKSHWAP